MKTQILNAIFGANVCMTTKHYFYKMPPKTTKTISIC